MFQVKFVDKKNTFFTFSNVFFENQAVCEKMFKNIVDQCRPQMTILRMRFACRIPKATNVHSDYVILVFFPLQEWLHERPSMLSSKHESEFE
jgi:hypothetical protein